MANELCLVAHELQTFFDSFTETGDEEVMNQLAMPILDDSVCKNIWQDFITGTEICAGYENAGKDFCAVSTRHRVIFLIFLEFKGYQLDR